MKKLHVAIVLLLLIAAFAATDFAVNVKRTRLQGVPPPSADPYPNFVQSIVGKNPDIGYVFLKRNRTKQLFEKFDLSSLENIRIYRSILEQAVQPTAPEEKVKKQMVIYEVQGPDNQGGLTYLNIKLKLIDQLDATGNINEAGSFGYNSFFYNDMNYPDTAFLLVQIKDNLFGFQYEKTDEETFKTVKAIIASLM